MNWELILKNVALIEMGIIHTRLSMGCLLVQQNFPSWNEDNPSQEHYKFQFPDLIVDMLILRVNSNVSSIWQL